MPYPAGHADATRASLVHSAVHLFGRRGFDDVTIDDIAAGAGRTRGVFYRYFDTKAELFVEAILTGVVGEAGEFESLVRAYLSAEHVDDPEGCPLIRFPEAAARGSAELRSAYTTVANSIIDAFQAALPPGAPRTSGLATLALCVGGMVIARATDDADLARDVREACIAAALAQPQNGVSADRRAE